MSNSSGVEKVNIYNFTEIAPGILESGYPIYLRGKHGIGKSELIKAIAAIRGKKVIEVRLSQIGEGEIIGLPVPGNDNDAVHYRPMHWMLEASKEPCVLFFDEIDRASKSIRQATFQITDSRKVHNISLHPKTDIIVAGNAGDDSSLYAVEPMDPAELSRYFVFEFGPTVPEWIHWARENNLNQMVIDYIKSDNSALDWIRVDENVPHPTRRGWARLARVLTASGYTDAAEIASNKNKRSLIRTLASSVVGTQSAAAFSGWLDRQINAPTTVMILQGEVSGFYSKLTNEQNNKLINEFREKNPMKERLLTANELSNLLDWAESFSHKELTTSVFGLLRNNSSYTTNEKSNVEKNRMAINKIGVDPITKISRYGKMVAETLNGK